MKIKISNYRTIKNAKYEFVDGRINYVIGSNESGKTNLFSAIRIISSNDKKISITKDDPTINKNSPIDLNEVSFKFSYDEFENEINSSREHVYLSKNLNYYSEYVKLIDSLKSSGDNLKSLIENAIANTDESNKTLSIDDLRNLKKFFEIAMSKELWSTREFSSLKKILEDQGKFSMKPELYKSMDAFFTKIVVFYNSLMLTRPTVYFIEPVLNAYNEEKIKYPWNDLTSSTSLLRNIFESFANSETLKNLNDLLSSTGGENDNNSRRRKKQLIDDINKSIKEYFNKNLSFIKGYPYFTLEGSIVILDIKSNDLEELEIDSQDEKSRSLGFKSFIRIFFDIKSLSRTDERTIYIIDEPEHGLHPFLQRLLIREIDKVLSQSKNLTVLISTHSPYILKLENYEDFDKLVCFVLRNRSIKNSELISGETTFEKFTNKKLMEKLILLDYEKSISSNYEYEGTDEVVFLYKMVMESNVLHTFDTLLNKKIKKLRYELSKGKISKDYYELELSKLLDIKNVNK